MKLPLLVAALTTGLALSTAAAAHPGGPGHRHYAAVHTPKVAVSPIPRLARPAKPYCAVYGCSGSATADGPQGNTVTWSGSANCDDGICTRSGSATGPNGGTATFEGSISQ